MVFACCFQAVLVSTALTLVAVLEGCGSGGLTTAAPGPPAPPGPPGVLQVSVDPAIVEFGTWVTVSYTGVPAEELALNTTEYVCQIHKTCKDVGASLWIGLFEKGSDRSAIGPQSWDEAKPPWLATSPVKWKPVYATAGTVHFKMESPREHEFEFVFFSNGTTWPKELAASNSLTYSDAGKPQHVRLARTSSHTEMRVSWSSAVDEPGAMVRWGSAAGSLGTNSTAHSFTYTKDDVCGQPAASCGWWKPPMFHTAVLSPMPAGRVYYSVGSDAIGWSEERSFSAPTPPAASASLRAVLMADVGESYDDGSQYYDMRPFAINTTAFAAQVVGGGEKKRMIDVPQGNILKKLSSQADTRDEAPAELVIHAGDVAYANGYAWGWDRFLTQIEAISSRAPYMTTQGNHERDWPDSGSYFGSGDSGGECGIPTQKRFIMPTPPQGEDNGWYSFDQGPVHFTVLSTEFSLFNNSAQQDWLKSDLANVDRTMTPWIVVYGHRPMYSAAFALYQPLHAETVYHTEDCPWCVDLEAVLVQHQVDLYVCGHVHSAELTCPVVNGTCIQPAAPGDYDAPVHVNVGNGGQAFDAHCLPDMPDECCCNHAANCTAACDAIPAWSSFRLDQFGYAILEVEGATNLTVSWYLDCVGTRDGQSMYRCNSSNELVYSVSLARRADLRAPLHIEV